MHVCGVWVSVVCEETTLIISSSLLLSRTSKSGTRPTCLHLSDAGDSGVTLSTLALFSGHPQIFTDALWPLLVAFELGKLDQSSIQKPVLYHGVIHFYAKMVFPCEILIKAANSLMSSHPGLPTNVSYSQEGMSRMEH